MIELLDCTIRDGGYVNNWEFTEDEVKNCYKSVSEAGFSYFEIGFRTNKNNKGKGKWFYCEESDIVNIKKSYMNGCKISIMTRIEDINLDLESFLPKEKSCIDLVRVFLTYENDKSSSERSGISLEKLIRCKEVLSYLKKLNYKTCLNIGSTIVLSDDDFLNIYKIIVSNVEIDYIYFADSYGSLMFDNFDYNINKLNTLCNSSNNSNQKIKIGFHAHNNLGNAYPNFIKCLQKGINIVDCTISGLGRGSGNLHSEICILHMYKNFDKYKYNLKPLLNYSNKYINPINKFYGKYKYGYNNILMICGMYNIHPNYGLYLINNYILEADEYFDILIKINDLCIQNHNFNYDKTLIPKLMNNMGKNNNIKIIFMDYDGTISNNLVYIDHEGNQSKTFNTKDGYIIKKLSNKYIFGIISGSNLSFLKKRAEYLGIKYIFDNISLQESKLEKINELLNELNLKIENIAYIGDDLNDLELIENCFSGCPNDSNINIKNTANFICKKTGGNGCVREFIDYIESIN